MAGKENRAKAALGGKKSSSSKSKKGGKKVHKMHVSRSQGDSHYLVHHESEPPADMPGAPGEMSDAHVVDANPEALASHIAEHMPMAGGDQEAAAAPAPAAAPAQA